MSCLSKSYRLNTKNTGSKKKLSREFNRIYKSNKKWHTQSFVVFFLNDEESQFAFISSKKVGNAVYRAKAKRKLRALVLEEENRLKKGKYIFVAKNTIFGREHNQLKKDFAFAMKKLGLFI